MKKNLTVIIIIAGVAAAASMLIHAFAPALYKSLATVIFMFALLGIAVLLAPAKKFDMKSFINFLVVIVVTGAVAWAFGKLEAVSFATIPLIAAVAALGMILVKNEEYALSAAVFSAAAAVYSAGNIVTYELLAVAYCVAVAALNARKIKSFPVRVAAVFLICLALCAFK